MTVNRFRGEVALPDFGEGVFLAFDLEDFNEIEGEFGRQFYDRFEQACIDFSLPDLTKIMAIGLRKRDGDGKVEKTGKSFDFRGKFQDGYDFRQATQPIMDAISVSWLGKTHAELVEDALEARKKQDAENLKRAKEAADAADLPFDEASSSGLLNLLIALASGQTTKPASGG
jgi:hypothetical protein